MESRKVSNSRYLGHSVVSMTRAHDAGTMATVRTRVQVSRHRLPPYGDGTSPTTTVGATLRCRWAGRTSSGRPPGLGIYRMYPYHVPRAAGPVAGGSRGRRDGLADPSNNATYRPLTRGGKGLILDPQGCEDVQVVSRPRERRSRAGRVGVC